MAAVIRTVPADATTARPSTTSPQRVVRSCRSQPYTADSPALATLELAVHLTGARVELIAIELDVPGRSVPHLDRDTLPDGWRSDDSITQPVGASWARTEGTVDLTVPSALVDARSGERNVLRNPPHRRFDRVAEVQRFAIEIDRRLT